MSEYNGSEVKRLIQVYLKINVHISIFLWGEAPNGGAAQRRRSCTDSFNGSSFKSCLAMSVFCILLGAIWRLTRRRRSAAETKCRMSEYNGSEVKRLI